MLSVRSKEILSRSLLKPLFLCIRALSHHAKDGQCDCRTPSFVLYSITCFTSEHARDMCSDPRFCAYFVCSHPLICATWPQFHWPTAHEVGMGFQTPQIVHITYISNPSNCAFGICGSSSWLRGQFLLLDPLNCAIHNKHQSSIEPLKMCIRECLKPPILCITL